MKTYRADLHVHSSHSNKPSYWALRKFNCPESYSSPEFIYNAARRQGMNYVTITDHNTINGALEIAHHPGAFISAEVTAYFPEDGCKVHVVTLDINEEKFRDINLLRKNIYELVAYLDRNAVPHFIAHPLYAQNEKLNADHFEKMLLLFRVFETKNGSRAKRYGALLEEVLEGITPAKLARLADRHGIEPVGESPWNKGRVGGSDDHGGLFIANAHTVVTGGVTLHEFLHGVAQRRSRPAGEDGDPLVLAHSLYGITHTYYRRRFGSGSQGSMPFIKALLEKFFDFEGERASFLEKLKLFIRKTLPDSVQGGSGDSFEGRLDREARRLLRDEEFLRVIDAETRNRKIFAVTSYLANRMIYLYSQHLTRISLDSGFFDLRRFARAVRHRVQRPLTS